MKALSCMQPLLGMSKDVQECPSTVYETILVVEFSKVCWMRQTCTVKMDTMPFVEIRHSYWWKFCIAIIPVGGMKTISWFLPCQRMCRKCREI